MFLLILLWTLIFLFWMCLKRDTNKDEPPTLVNLDWRKLYRLTEDTEGFWSLIKEISRECQKQDGVIKVTIGPKTLYVLTDPEDSLTVSNACLHKDRVYDFAKNWIGNGLITASLPIWKIHRRVLDPLFSTRILNNFMEVFNSLSRVLIKNLEVEVDKGPFDPYYYSRRHSLELICTTTFGTKLMDNIECKNKYMEKVEKIMNVITSRIQVILLHNNFLYSFSSLKKKEDEYVETLSNITSTVLNEIKTSFKAEKSLNTDEEKKKGFEFEPFAETILKISENNTQFTDQDIRQHVDTFIAAGEDTSAGVIMLCLITVGSYPQVQKEIHKELKQIFGDEDRDVTREDLSKLVYLEAVIKETMRFYPIVPIIARDLDKDIKLSNCTLSKGRSAVLSIYGIHRHPMWGPDADEFRPERWLDLPLNYQKYFAAFSLGRRICIGKTMAIASLKVTMAHIFRNYIIHGEHTNMKLKFELTLKAVSGHHISIGRRIKNKP
ncbi:cytochrome P450 4V2-like isoform X1 [Danaus plexippus]|uniref:cytochrome P450 4V2-like isoform X1 n=1 Tax=Danaus plexippus TaxID=13037 RepID=UPI002AB1879E|nr:cytochrome P450 4V2-like isoform X1 [Danaus plexippus]XP_061380022.1 cytochrome P450 4V2-like isoform X1 [Danaus plexippus]